MKKRSLWALGLLLVLMLPNVSQGQQPAVVVNAAHQFGPGQALSPCSYGTMYTPIVNPIAIAATNQSTNVLAGYRLQVLVSDQEQYLAALTYVSATGTNGQVNFILPCVRSLANNNVILRLQKQLPLNNTFADVALTGISLGEFTPAAFGQPGEAFAGLYYQVEREIGVYLSMVMLLPDKQLGAAEFVLKPWLTQAMVLYTTGGTAYVRGRDNITLKINGLEIAYLDYYGPPDPGSPLPSPFQQANFILKAQTIIDAGLAQGQFLDAEMFANGIRIGKGKVRFKRG